MTWGAMGQGKGQVPARPELKAPGSHARGNDGRSFPLHAAAGRLTRTSTLRPA